MAYGATMKRIDANDSPSVRITGSETLMSETGRVETLVRPFVTAGDRLLRDGCVSHTLGAIDRFCVSIELGVSASDFRRMKPIAEALRGLGFDDVHEDMPGGMFRYRCWTSDPRIAARFRYLRMAYERKALTSDVQSKLDAAVPQRDADIVVFRHRGHWIAGVSAATGHDMLFRLKHVIEIETRAHNALSRLEAAGWRNDEHMMIDLRIPGADLHRYTDDTAAVAAFAHRMTDSAYDFWSNPLPAPEAPCADALDLFEEGWTTGVDLSGGTTHVSPHGVRVDVVSGNARYSGLEAVLRVAGGFESWTAIEADRSKVSPKRRGGHLSWSLDRDGVYELRISPVETVRFARRSDRVRLMSEEDVARHFVLACPQSQARIEAAKATLPALTGSEKQVAWADGIRLRVAARAPEYKALTKRTDATWWIDNRFDFS